MELLENLRFKQHEMVSLVESWVNINSYTENRDGIEKFLKLIKKAFSSLNPDEMQEIQLPNQRKGLFLKKRAQAPLQAYFGGHLDTVFPNPAKAAFLDEHTLQGPGAADMKGGLVVMLKALEIFETTDRATEIGWEIFLNPDEEIGSPDSTPFIEQCAQRCHVACIFEPLLEDGSFVSQRKGSSNYIIRSYGKKAHAGRNPEEGKNAIFPLVSFISSTQAMNQPERGVLVNVGLIKGGEAQNIIPDYAECHLNVRADHLESLKEIEKKLMQEASHFGLDVTCLSFRPPKPFDEKTKALFEILKACGASMGLQIRWKESGGVCDGNIFAAKGIPTIDTLGVRGGKIHTEQEYLHLISLTEQTKLTVLFLNEIAKGKIKI